MASSKSALTEQEVVDKLDEVPVFHIMNADRKLLPVPDGSGGTCLRFYADPAEAQAVLDSVQALNPDVTLHMGVTPLGTAFALTQGWAPNEANVPLHLRSFSSVVTKVATELAIEMDPDGAFPLFGSSCMTSATVTPFWLSPADLHASWEQNGRPGGEQVPDVTITDLAKVVKLALSDGSERNWNTLLLLAPPGSIAKAQSLQEGEQARSAAGLDSEPPPLQ